ncbi:uncharacterized protein [Ptychodera flava]|uniref:uncharacterized protein isoform X1 n=1 Tax=Ptychodera flava TaxID=63121 RepID=UPI00396A870E
MFVTNKSLFFAFFGALLVVLIMSATIGHLGLPSDQFSAVFSVIPTGRQNLPNSSLVVSKADMQSQSPESGKEVLNVSHKYYDSTAEGQLLNQRHPIDDEENLSKSDTIIKNTQQERYLLPIEYYNSGPNYLYNLYKCAIVMAMYQKRSIVELPFPDHFGQHALDKRSRLRTFNATFDLSELKSVVGTISIDEFKKRCNNSVDAVLMYPERPWDDEEATHIYENYELHREVFASLHGIRLPKGSKVPTKGVLYSDGSGSPSERMKCLGMFSMLKFRHVNLPDQENITAKMVNHFKRAKNVRQIAQRTMEKLCEKRNYLSIHWRNKSGEGCRPNRPGPCHDSVRAFNENAKNIIPDIKVLMAEHGLSCVYVAHDTYSKEIVRILQKGTVPRVYDQDSILTPNGTDMAMFQDPYFMSLLEQEICLQSGLFLSTTNSNWSSFVTAVMRLQKLPEIQMERLPSWNPVPKKRRL